MQTLSVVAARRIAINAQGYAGRARNGTTRDVERAVQELSCVQLDSISVVERSHRIAIGSRVGRFPRDAVTRLLGSGRLFEYWAHEACLLPAEDWPLFRTAMDDGGRGWFREVERTHPHLARRDPRGDPHARPARFPAFRGGRAEEECGTGSRRRRRSTVSGTAVSS